MKPIASSPIPSIKFLQHSLETMELDVVVVSHPKKSNAITKKDQEKGMRSQSFTTPGNIHGQSRVLPIRRKTSRLRTKTLKEFMPNGKKFRGKEQALWRTGSSTMAIGKRKAMKQGKT
ncbi:hypothetical protein HPP92_017631 [Vanilla planifolia]|uniref:Uncharacterized protein n=1 Tax=Vanilla planifolia TaxID=51239 RepID=A0A835QGG1_VANPL|nr:hypothetical protein HPP92_017631 [Vanilla planifolia]